MNYRRLSILLIALTFMAMVSYVSYQFGMNGAIGRNTYINSVLIREEQKCIVIKNFDCLNANWNVRMGVTAEIAKTALKRPYPTTVESELREYVKWVEQQPAYRPQKNEI